MSKETLRKGMTEDGLWVPHARRRDRVYQARNHRTSVFRNNLPEPQGGDGVTQFGRALSQLYIDIICANFT